VDIKNWDEVKRSVNTKDPNARVLNSQLLKIVGKVNEAYNQLEALGEDFDIHAIKEKLTGNAQHYLMQFFEKVLCSIKSKVGHGYSYGTFKHYKSTCGRLKKFIKYKYGSEDFIIRKVDYDFINSFDTYLKVEYSVMPITTNKYHKQLKKVLMDAVAMGMIDKNPYVNFKLKTYQTNRNYLTLQEVKAIEDKEISIKRIGIVRDIFVFACYTGMSYTDIYNLSQNHLVLGNDGEKWIIIDRGKTGVRCRVPLLPKAEDVLNRYNDYPSNSSTGKLLPVNSNQKMNAYLKEIADICNISKKLTMHVARHTFATSITLEKGVPIETVSKMLGHNSIKTTQIYGRIVDAKISRDMRDLRSKLTQ